MSKLTPKELADKTVKDLKKRKRDKAKRVDQDVMHVLVDVRNKAYRKKVGQV